MTGHLIVYTMILFYYLIIADWCLFAYYL